MVVAVSRSRTAEGAFDSALQAALPDGVISYSADGTCTSANGMASGLLGIPLEARILAVADVVETMSSHRPYRPALGLEAALAEITQHRGVFDRKVVRACVIAFNSGTFSFESTWLSAAPGRRPEISVHSASAPLTHRALAKAASRATS